MPESNPTGIEVRRERSESARLDNFVDGAFAFAITLLIISGGGLPRTVAALEHALRGIPAFAACFALLAFFWHGHVRWRDTVRLTDAASLRLSLLLVFFALIFVFPLHLVFSGLFNGISGSTLSPDFTSSISSSTRDTQALFICYGVAFACMAGTLAMLYRHGVRVATCNVRADAISLRSWLILWTFYACVGLLSIILALVLPVHAGWIDGIPGFSYFLLAFSGPLAHFYSRHLEAKLPP